MLSPFANMTEKNFFETIGYTKSIKTIFYFQTGSIVIIRIHFVIVMNDECIF